MKLINNRLSSLANKAICLLNRLILLASLALLSATLSSCNSIKHRTNNPDTSYQQCHGIEQKMQFLHSEDFNNSRNQFQIQQQFDNLDRQYQNKGCGKVLSSSL